MEGVRTQVACVVQSGDLPLSLQWYKNGLAISQPDISITSAQYSSILSIERVARGHAGNYTCVATNAAKSTQATAQLIVAGNRIDLSPHKSRSTCKCFTWRYYCLHSNHVVRFEDEDGIQSENCF